MEQHPIPQQISSYQFRLVGDMTLKQFFQLAGGFLVALLFYSTPLLPIIKWPFVIVSATLGVALAFLPLEERPLERWIFAFFRAIYSPTMFFWQKTVTEPKFFQDETGADATNAPAQDAALKSYLAPTSPKGPLSVLENAEKTFLSTLTGLFAGNTTTQTVTPLTQPGATQPLTIPQTHPEIVPNQTQPEIKKEIAIPQSTPVKVVDSRPKHLVVEEKPRTSTAPGFTTQAVAPVIVGDEMVSTKQAVFSTDAAPPNPPSIPNVVVGQVVDNGKKIVEGAIMEVKDSGGRPIRALRSNKLGHFITVTPLESGIYDIVTEKDGFEFSPVRFEAQGQIIPPILVQGQKTSQPTPTQP